MEKKGKEKKTIKNAKKDPLNFVLNKKNAFIIKTLVLKGVNVPALAKEIIEKFPGSPNERITAGTIKTTLKDFTLSPGTFSPSRGIELTEEKGVYKIKDKRLREKLKKEYKEFYLLTGKDKK